MIKIRFRKNLLYLFIYYIASFINFSVLSSIFYTKFILEPIKICIYLYPVENIIGGIIVYLYQRNSVKKKEEIKYFGLDLVHNHKNVVNDGIFKKIILFFIASYFNYYNIIVSLFYYVDYIPLSMDLRISSIQLIASALICAISFDFKFKKHHKLSLIVISIFLFLSICHDMFYIAYYKYKNIRIPIFQYFISLYYYIGFSFNNCIEKYLVDADYMNPFLILMIEGIFQLIFSLFIPIWKNPFDIFKDKKITKNFTLFIILFILFALFQIVVNIYRIYCNVIYSPMARSLIDYFLNPFVNIHFYFEEKIFFNNVAYFIVTEIFCCVMSFFGCVFNEYIVLYCYGLEFETQDEIAERACVRENERPINQSEMKIIDDNESINSNDDRNNKIAISNTIVSVGTYHINI